MYPHARQNTSTRLTHPSSTTKTYSTNDDFRREKRSSRNREKTFSLEKKCPSCVPRVGTQQQSCRQSLPRPLLQVNKSANHDTRQTDAHLPDLVGRLGRSRLGGAAGRGARLGARAAGRDARADGRVERLAERGERNRAVDFPHVRREARAFGGREGRRVCGFLDAGGSEGCPLALQVGEVGGDGRGLAGARVAVLGSP